MKGVANDRAGNFVLNNDAEIITPIELNTGAIWPLIHELGRCSDARRLKPFPCLQNFFSQ
jgi:hypothetical protein